MKKYILSAVLLASVNYASIENLAAAGKEIGVVALKEIGAASLIVVGLVATIKNQTEIKPNESVLDALKKKSSYLLGAGLIAVFSGVSYGEKTLIDAVSE